MLDKENFFSKNKFELPIEFLENKTKVLDNLKIDLELEKTIDNEIDPIYTYVFNPKTELGKTSIKTWGKYYTTDKKFLKDSQKIYKEIDTIPMDNETVNNMLKSWREVRHQNDFMEKYQYVEWEKLKWLNKSTLFLSILSFYNISSPVLQLITPIFVLLVPFFVLKAMKLPMTWETYYKILIENVKQHAIGNCFLLLVQPHSVKKCIYFLLLVCMFGTFIKISLVATDFIRTPFISQINLKL